MQLTNKIKTTNWIIAICFVLLIGISAWIYLQSDFHNEVTLSAWHSTKTTCSVKSQTIEDFQAYANDNGFIIQGLYDPANDSIVIVDQNPEEYLKIYKHERCHQIQSEENRSHGCEVILTTPYRNFTINTEWMLFLDEVECYLAQRKI